MAAPTDRRRRTRTDARLVDGYANGWLVDPTTDESFDVVLEWAPQRSVWAGLAVSVAAVLGCLAIVAVTWWRRRAGALALVTAPAAADSQVSIEWPRANVRPSRAERGSRRY